MTKVQGGVQVKLQPLSDRVIVKALDAEETTKGGIVLPDTAKEKPQEGKIIAVGTGRRLDDGKVQAYAGGYGDWLKQGKHLTESDNLTQHKKLIHKQESEDRKNKSGGKLSYKLKRELDQLPDRIEKLEAEISELQTQTHHPDFYNQTYEVYQPVLDQLVEKETELEKAVDRWGELEGRVRL